MTNSPRRYPAPSSAQTQDCSTLPAVPEMAALLRVRVLPAQFARMLGVSKQTVSRWIQAQKVTISPMDGRLDPHLAIQQVLRNTDPGRMRVRLLQLAIGDVNEMRQALSDRVRQADALAARLDLVRSELDQLRRTLEVERAARAAEMRAAEQREDSIVDALVLREPEFRCCADSNAWQELAYGLQESDYDSSTGLRAAQVSDPQPDDETEALAALALHGSCAPHCSCD